MTINTSLSPDRSADAGDGHSFDISVSTPRLRAIASELRALAADFGDARRVVAAGAREIGHGGLRHAVGSFAGNWSRHRARLVARALALADAAAGAAATYERLEATLGACARERSR
jgi:hypothetical protein